MKKIISFIALALIAIPLAVYAQDTTQQNTNMHQNMQSGKNMQGMHMMCNGNCPMCSQMIDCMKDGSCSMQDQMKSMRSWHQNMGKMMDQMQEECNGDYDNCPAMREHMKEMQQMHKDMGNMQNNKWNKN